MFERDCLGYTFDLWARPNSDLHREASVSASDVLADIADIRALPSRHPEIREVDVELLSAVDAIEAYVLLHRPTMQSLRSSARDSRRIHRSKQLLRRGTPPAPPPPTNRTPPTKTQKT